jgi:competence protein ComEC
VSGILFYSSVFGFACGIFLRSIAPVSSVHALVLLLLAFSLALVWRRAEPGAFHAFLAAMVVVCASVSLGVMRMDAAAAGTASPYFAEREGSQMELEGKIVREPDRREKSTQLTLASEYGRVLVFADPSAAVRYGDTVTVRGVVKRPEAFETDLGRTFDYEGYLHARGISYTLQRAEVLARSPGGNSVLSALFSFKQRFLTAIEAAMPMPEAGLGEGLLLGVKSSMGSELEDAFRRAGVVHIVVLSGYNIMLVVTFVMTILAYFLPHRLRLIVGMFAIAAFALLVGLSATVLRASIMAVLMLFALLTGRTYAVLRALFLAAALMLLVDPYLLVYDVGFQFSMIATLGLILLSPIIEPKLQVVPKSFGIRGFLTATLATQIFILPILLYHMGQFSLVAIPVNLLVLPAVPFAMLLAFCAGILGLISPILAVPAGLLAQGVLFYILFIVRFFASLPFSALAVPPFPFFIAVLAYAFLCALLFLQLRKKEEKGNDRQSLASWTIMEESAYTESAARAETRAAQTPVFFR